MKHKVRDRMDKKIETAIKKSGQKKVFVIYSAYDEDESDNPIDNLNEIAVKGKVVLVGDADEFWGGETSLDYCSPVLENPTWLEVCVHANRMIQTVRDEHHVFLEGLDKKRRKVKRTDGVTEYEFSMGS
jgi:hypothetical protein